MSLGVIHIVEGFTAEQKQELIKKTKLACMEGFDLTEDHSFVYIQETKEENADEQTKTMACLYVYTTYGKTIYGKDTISAGFDKACKEALGDKIKRTIVIFKEHTDENAGSNGNLRPLGENYPKGKK
ncbi:hypothetical protein LJB89_01805 [Tyzzerella sp. OttesenSCG-928-J15]|nr:hypothetical protein [Tyzzerella sp. OttesenSCG-928-J15]